MYRIATVGVTDVNGNAADEWNVVDRKAEYTNAIAVDATEGRLLE
jgi:hypothetical protein